MSLGKPVSVCVTENILRMLRFPGFDDITDAAQWYFKVVTRCVYVYQRLPGGCIGNCAYCNQARSLAKADTPQLCNYAWPEVDLGSLLAHIANLGEQSHVEAFCIQTMFHKDSFENQLAIVEQIASILPEAWITTATTPRTPEQLSALAKAGLRGICVPLELATEKLFEDIRGRGVKGPYRWDRQLEALRAARDLFPDVLTHLMIGMGETEREAVECISMVQTMGIRTSIFPFLPIPGTALHANPRGSGRPQRPAWRRIQLARFLLNEANLDPENIQYEGDRVVGFRVPHEQFMRLVESGRPFMSSGCKCCSRPGYAEDPPMAGADLQQWRTAEPYVYQLTPWPGTIRRLLQEMELRSPVAADSPSPSRAPA